MPRGSYDSSYDTIGRSSPVALLSCCAVLPQHLSEMERLRKRLEDLRVKARRFVNRNWHNDPQGDVFRSLDALFVLGAVRYKPTHRWQRICWTTYCFMSICSYLIFVLNFLDEIPRKFNIMKFTWHATVVLIETLCFVKDHILNRHFDSIQTTRMFINSKQSGSGDTSNDVAYRTKFFQRLQSIALVLLAVMLMDQVIFIVPNPGINELYGTPRILRHLRPSLADGIHFLHIFTIAPIWINKYCAGTGTICSLLYGFKTEYEIFVRGFRNILDNVYSDVEEKLPSSLKATPDWKRRQRDLLFWKFLEQRITEQAKLHVQLVENLQLLQPIVSDLFGIIYYNAMVTFSPFIYVVLLKGPSIVSVCVVSAIVINLLECYAWCKIIESINDINETLEVNLFDLIVKIPHSTMHHEKYVEMRTSLHIMKTFMQNNPRFYCGGVFPITVEAFTNLLNIGYKVLTFLRDVGRKG